MLPPLRRVTTNRNDYITRLGPRRYLNAGFPSIFDCMRLYLSAAALIAAARFPSLAPLSLASSSVS